MHLVVVDDIYFQHYHVHCPLLFQLFMCL